jgi:HrpA-like RNA helicase
MNDKYNPNINLKPVEFFKDNLMNSVKKFQITIIQAETGSGKTIFIPKIFYFSKIFKKIFISQTKRVATIGAATFLSNIFGEKLGNLVGYTVRFENKTNHTTKIKFMTDGIFFQKIINNFFFEKDTCIIIDEFHERTLNTDLLICMLKKILDLRKDLKLIFMSASGDSSKIANYFEESVGKIDIPGSMYKIKTFYSCYSHLDFIISLCSTITKCHLMEKLSGDFLIFLPGYGEILECEKMINFLFQKKFDNFFIYKLHSNLPLSEQLMVFRSLNLMKRKIILSTNIAESSLTIKGIKFVFDSGLSKQKILNWKTGFILHKISPISKSEAKQRSGRAGRISNGKCFRMYTYIEYSKFKNFPKPEIQRTDLSSLILHILSSKFSALFSFDFIDLPPLWLIKRSLENLFILGAINEKIKLTWIGKFLSIYPIDIKLSKCLVQSLQIQNEKITCYVLLSCSMLSVNYNFNVFNMHNDFDIKEKSRKLFKIKDECFFIASILKKFLNIKENFKKRIWCKMKKIDFCIFEVADKIQKQLYDINKLSRKYFFFPQEKKKLFNRIHEGFRYCFTSGFFQNSGRILDNFSNLQIITSGILVSIKKFNKKITRTNFLFLFFELLISFNPSIRGLTSTKLQWLLYFGNKLFF